MTSQPCRVVANEVVRAVSRSVMAAWASLRPAPSRAGPGSAPSPRTDVLCAQRAVRWQDVDVTGLPREIIYVDVQRVRSYLAQMDEGVIEEVKSLRNNDVNTEVSARVFGIGGTGGYSHNWGTEESRSLQDLTLNLFLDAAEESAVLRDAADHTYEPTSWEDGSAQSSFVPGELVRATCELRLFDAALFRARMERFIRMMDALARIVTPANPPTQPQGRNGRAPSQQAQRDGAVRATRSTLMQGPSDDYIKSICDFTDAFLGDNIAMRALPCGEGHSEFSFSGSLLTRADYIQEEREHLFSRYGTKMGKWTCIMQITAVVPNPADESTGVGPDDQSFPVPDLLTASGDISRAGYESMTSNLLTLMEGVGLADGPRWPAVSVTPLALYRPASRSPLT